MGPRMNVWVTRARPGADATAARLADLGHTAIVAPLIEARPLAGVDAALGPEVGALAFTSIHGVRAFAGLTTDRSRPAFAVGEATASAARSAGFTMIATGDGNVSALARTIIAGRGRFRGGVVHPGAAEPAGDLTGGLAAAGIAVRRLTVYETGQVAALPEQIASHRPEVVLVQSPKAARALAQLLPEDWAGAMTALALSKACAEPLAAMGFKRLVAAAFPQEASLLKLLGP